MIERTVDDLVDAELFRADHVANMSVLQDSQNVPNTMSPSPHITGLDGV